MIFEVLTTKGLEEVKADVCEVDSSGELVFLLKQSEGLATKVTYSANYWLKVQLVDKE